MTHHRYFDTLLAMVTVLAIAVGMVIGLQHLPFMEAVAFVSGAAVLLAVGRVIQFHSQEWAWVLIQIDKVGKPKYVKGQLMLAYGHALWYGLIVGAFATLAYFWFT